MRKIFFLLNPSQPYRLWDLREAAGAAAKRAGWMARFGEVDRSRPHSTEDLLRQAIAEGSERLVVVGGDGSLHRAVVWLSRERLLERLPLALVPSGTCNDFARVLGLAPRQTDAAMRLACSGTVSPVDLPAMNGVPFLNNAGFGRRLLPSTGKRVKPLKSLRSFQPTFLKATWEKGAIEGPFLMAMACNAPFFSRGLHFSRAIQVNDGFLDLYLVPPVSKWRLLQRLIVGRIGRPIFFKRVLSLRTKRVEIEAGGDLWPQADGEPGDQTPTRRLVFEVGSERVMIARPATPSGYWAG